MNALIAFFTNKWVIQGLGILVLALVVWITGPMIVLSDGTFPLASVLARVLIIAGLFLIWGLWHLIALVLAGRKDRELINQLNKTAQEVGTAKQEMAEKVQLLRSGFESAAQLLKQSHAKDKAGKQFLYELPWYVIIGAPGSGKTTALINSGLKFPAVSQSANDPRPVKGVGGTRNCDWWFTDEAVLLDTAGRYITQDSHQEVDEKEWLSFLDLLKEFRPKRPLNGILVTTSLAELLEQTEEQTKRHAEVLRRRIQEVQNALGTQIPIYMLFTKVDLVAGFNEFFRDFSPEQRKQVWGETFPAADPAQPLDWLNAFGSAFNELMARLEPHTYKGIQEERNVLRRSLILGFPKQMMLMKPTLLTFLEAVFAFNRYEKQPCLLRGVYFTCGTQEGNPIDRLMTILTSAFRLDRRSAPVFNGQGKSFFLNRLLQGVVFAEAELAGTDPKIQRKERLIQLGVWGSVLLFTLGMVGLWGISYSQNQTRLDETKQQIDQFQAEKTLPTDTRANFKLLQQKLDIVLNTKNIWENSGWFSHFGLSQADKLESTAEETYHRLVQQFFVPAIVIRLQERLQSKPDIATLKAYRMLGKQDWDKFDANVLKDVLTADWAQLFNADQDAFNSLQLHLKNLLEMKANNELVPVELDSNVRTRVIQQLTGLQPYERCYSSFKQLKTDDAHNFNLAEQLGPNAPKVFVAQNGQDLTTLQPVPALFTLWGYKEFVLVNSAVFVKSCLDDSWVLDEPDSQMDFKRIYGQFMVLYADEYAEKWRTVLASVKLKPVQSLRQTAELLDLLSRPESSPLVLLLRAVASNTRLSSAVNNTTTLATALAEKANIAPLNKGMELSKKLSDVDVGEIIGKEVQAIEKSFAPINDLVNAGQDKSMPLDSALAKAKELSNSFLRNGDAEQAQLSVVNSGDGSNAVEQAKMEFKNLPVPMNGWLLSLANGGLGESIGKAKEALKEKAKSGGIIGPGSACNLAFSGRYPFVRGSSKDVPLADFVKYFASNGLLDQFFQQNLKAVVDTSALPWRQKKADGQSVTVSQEAIRQFQAAAKIRDSYFPAGGQNLDVQFDLKLISMSPGVDNIRISNEGQELVYKNGQSQAARVHWPGPTPGTGVQFIFETPDKKQVTSPRKTGPWALFRMLDESSLERSGGAELFRVSFQSGMYFADFEIQALSMNNPFSLGDSRNFHCPGTL